MKARDFREKTHVKRREISSVGSVEPLRECGADLPALNHHYEPTVIRSIKVSGVLTALFLAVTYEGNERYTADNEDSEDSSTDICRLLAVIISLCQIAALVHYHRSRMRLQPPFSQQKCSNYQQLQPKILLVEVLLHCVVLPPRVNASWKLFQLGTYARLELSDVVFVLGLARIYHFRRVIFWISSYSSRKAVFYSYLEGVEDNSAFIWRCFLKKHTYIAFLLAWGVLNITGGLALRTFDHSVPFNKVDTLWSAFWSVVVSETTIGYGDVTPLTHVGRLTIIACITCGMAIYAFAIMNTHRAIELSPQQHVLYGAIHYAESYKRLRSPAALLVQRWWKYHRNRALGLPSLEHLSRFNLHIRTFRLMRRKFLSLQSPLLDQAIIHFEFAVKRRLFAEITRLKDIQSIENLVKST